MDKNEKYLKSIDNTLKDILKELKRQVRLKETTSVTIHGEIDSEFVEEMKNASSTMLERK